MGRITSRLTNVYKKHGFVGFFKKISAYVRANYLDKVSFKVLFCGKKYRKEIASALEEGFDRIILFRNSFGYGADMFQRPQHIAGSLSKAGCLVFYEVTSVSDKVKTLKKQDDRLYLFNFNNVRLHKILMSELGKLSCPKYVEVCSTDWKLSADDMEDYKKRGFGIVYEYIDHLAPELFGTRELAKSVAEKYDYSMSHKDVSVVVTARELLRDVESMRGKENLVLAGNGVDQAFFKDFDPSFTLEKEFSDVINNGKTNVCYYGALASWFDYDLIKKIGATGKYNVILFGIKFDASYDENMREAEGVYYFGRKDYRELKYYAKECDILTIPFIINEVTQATSPLKLYEYMALEKPIVTTDMNECLDCGVVFTAADHDGFIKRLEEAYAARQDEGYLARLRDEAKKNDWSEKAKLIVDILAENERGGDPE